MDYAADFAALPGGKAQGFAGGKLDAGNPTEPNIAVRVLQQELDNAKLRASGGFPKGPPIMGPVESAPATDYAADWEKLPGGGKPSEVSPERAKAYQQKYEGDYIKGELKASPFSGENTVEAAKTLGRDLRQGVANAVTGIGSTILSGYRGLSELAQGNSLDDAVKAIQDQQQSGTFQPEGKGGEAVAQTIALPGKAVGWVAKKAGEVAQEAGASPGGAAAIETGIVGAALLAGARGAKAPVSMPELPGGMVTKPADIAAQMAAQAEKQPFGTVGASAASKGATAQADVAGATPELQAAVKGIKDVNPEALARQVQADSLPIPVRLTKGQATQDPVQISFEQNNRGRMPELAQRFNEQSPQLHENLNAIRDHVAPDVFSAKPIENAEAVINGYKAKDAILNADISAKYKALEEANGGNFPVDSKAFADAAYAELGKKLKTDFTPSAIANQLTKFKEGEPMNFEQFEAMRTNLAAEIRKAQRSGDGNAAVASGIVRDALEKLPLAPEAAQLKPLADAARSAAKARFDLLRKDPAYDAAISDVAPDKFISRYIIGAPARDVQTMIKNLGPGSVEHQAIGAATINYLKDQAGTEANNFSQAGYNKALKGLVDTGKLPDMVGQTAAKQLTDVGEVARNTLKQPRGSFVNNSNTLTGAIAEHAKGFAEGAANKVLGFGMVPVGSLVRGALSRRAANQAITESLQTGAGIALKDIGKSK